MLDRSSFVYIKYTSSQTYEVGIILGSLSVMIRKTPDVAIFSPVHKNIQLVRSRDGVLTHSLTLYSYPLYCPAAP